MLMTTKTYAIFVVVQVPMLVGAREVLKSMSVMMMMTTITIKVTMMVMIRTMMAVVAIMIRTITRIQTKKTMTTIKMT